MAEPRVISVNVATGERVPVYVAGPTLCVDPMADGWLLYIEQPKARETRFDVYLRHRDGSRVPAGANLHEDWEREGERLIGMLHRPLRENPEVSRG